LRLRPPRPDQPVANLTKERIKRRPILRGLLNEYERVASKSSSRPVARFRRPTGIPA